MTISPSADPNLITVVYLCEDQPLSSFLHNVLEASSDSLEEGRTNFVRLLQQTDEDDDIALDVMDFEFSLLDPLSYQRMRIPVRSLRCSHVKCFDLENFVELYPEKANRSCPVCGQAISLQDLRQDSFVKSILEQTNDDEDEVKVTMNGEWRHCEKEEHIEDVDDMEEEQQEQEEEKENNGYNVRIDININNQNNQEEENRNNQEGLQEQDGGGFATAGVQQLPPVIMQDLPTGPLGALFCPNNCNAFGQPFEQAIQSVDPTVDSIAHHMYTDFSTLLNVAMATNNDEIIDLVSCSSADDEPVASTNNNNFTTNSTTSMYNTNRDPNLGSQIEIIDISDWQCLFYSNRNLHF